MADRKRTPIHIFAARLCAVRNERGMTQPQVADYLRRSRRWYQKIEAGTSKPNWQDTILLLTLFELDPASIVEEVGIRVSVLTHRK